MDIIIPQTPGIYKIFFLDPNLFYIGSAVNLRRRYKSHLNNLHKGTHTNPHLQNAYTKYGIDTLHFEVIENVEQREDLVKREQHYLDQLKPHYNICKVAFVPPRYSPSPELREKARIAMLGNTYAKGSCGPWKGLTMSKEHRAKLSTAHKGKPSPTKGKPKSDEHRAKLSTAHKGKTPWNKGIPASEEQTQRLREMGKARKGISPSNKGIPLTPEQRAKVSAAKKGKPSPKKGIPANPESVAKMRASLKGRTPWNKGIKSDKPSPKKGIPLTPEVKEQKLARYRATIEAKGGQVSPSKGKTRSPEMKNKISETLLNKTPEQRAETLAKRRANRATKNDIKQLSLWDEPLS